MTFRENLVVRICGMYGPLASLTSSSSLASGEPVLFVLRLRVKQNFLPK
jgi:hypothetical protein